MEHRGHVTLKSSADSGDDTNHIEPLRIIVGVNNSGDAMQGTADTGAASGRWEIAEQGVIRSEVVDGNPFCRAKRKVLAHFRRRGLKNEFKPAPEGKIDLLQHVSLKTPVIGRLSDSDANRVIIGKKIEQSSKVVVVCFFLLIQTQGGGVLAGKSFRDAVLDRISAMIYRLEEGGWGGV